ncbi:conserved Plasmodium protein, unknown function [Plasmodium ovale wallikeri]|uniref:Uncharacterized protein n=2 Tax=Plasmodium ovale TaxID=36330 RepID=A0A1A8YWV3_PLAOA|nr:conserved Plasmodium protein, unknown function [Plasmodium ovale wallikeri]SBT36426.1 conserved Plasmodium protein, unknown function [Plasmodium ovale wallikeri]SBT77401.1 conserved Plasmodium protein, unknown function [Plasmodium ovale]
MSFKNYCPFDYPSERSIGGLDDLLSSKENVRKLKNNILKNLEIDDINYDLNKIESKKSLLSNNDVSKSKKWYLHFQPLSNISIPQYWKYEKVTLKDILTSNMNAPNGNNVNIQLKKNKKYLKHICKCILKGNPHDSLLKNTFIYAGNYLNGFDKHSNISFKNNNLSSSILSLNSKAIKNTQNLLNWKLKYANNLTKFQEINPDENEKNSSTFRSTNLGNIKRDTQSTSLNKGNNSDIVSNKYKMTLKSIGKKKRKKS